MCFSTSLDDRMFGQQLPFLVSVFGFCNKCVFAALFTRAVAVVLIHADIVRSERTAHATDKVI